MGWSRSFYRGCPAAWSAVALAAIGAPAQQRVQRNRGGTSSADARFAGPAIAYSVVPASTDPLTGTPSTWQATETASGDNRRVTSGAGGWGAAYRDWTVVPGRAYTISVTQIAGTAGNGLVQVIYGPDDAAGDEERWLEPGAHTATVVALGTTIRCAIQTVSATVGHYVEFSEPDLRPAAISATIDGAGDLTIDTTAHRGSGSVTVRATNGAGSVDQVVPVRVGPQLGFSIPDARLLSLTEPQLDAIFTQAFADGACWVRIDFNTEWPFYDGPITTHAPYWAVTDLVFGRANAAGLKILCPIMHHPSWTGSGRFPTTNLSGWCTSVAAAVARYDGSGGRPLVSAWQIWNEPNLGASADDISAANYMAMAAPLVSAIRSAHPSAVLVGPGLSCPTDSVAGVRQSGADYLTALYANGFGSLAIDYLAAHPYTGTAFPSGTENWSAWHYLRTAMRTVCRTNGDQRKWWLTEYGCPTSGTTGTAAVSLQGQADRILDAWDEAAKCSWIAADKPLMVYEFRDLNSASGATTTENHFGVRYTDGSHKAPAIAALGLLRRGVGPEPAPVFSPSDPRLRLAPKPQSTPTLITVPSTYYAVTLADNEDATFTSAVQGGLGSDMEINGGRDIRLIGVSRRGRIAIKGNKGSVYLEGCRLDLSSTTNGRDAINAYGAPGFTPDVTIQRCFVTGVKGTNPNGSQHGDIFQPQGPVGRVRIDMLTGDTNYQGIFIRPEYLISSADLSRMNLTFNVLTNPGPDGNTYLVWVRNPAGQSAPGNPLFPVTFTQVWTQQHGTRTPTQAAVYPIDQDITGLAAGVDVGIVDGSGNVTFIPSSGITGQITCGTRTDYVPSGSVGVGYTMAGSYQVPWTA